MTKNAGTRGGVCGTEVAADKKVEDKGANAEVAGDKEVEDDGGTAVFMKLTSS